MTNDDISYNVYSKKDDGSHGSSLQSSCLCKKPRIYFLQMYKCNGLFFYKCDVSHGEIAARVPCFLDFI